MKCSNCNVIPLGALMAALAVILGAFGAHGIRGKVTDDLFDIYQTASHYLMIHAGAVILYGLWLKQRTLSDASPIGAWPAVCFMVGSFIFSGSLYAIVFTGIRMFGAITPIGGLLFIVGWLGFALQARHGK